MKIYRASRGTEKRVACPSYNQRKRRMEGRKDIE